MKHIQSFLPNPNLVIIKLCWSHLSKNITQDINKAVANDQLKCLMKEMFASLFEIDDIFTISYWFFFLCKIFAEKDDGKAQEAIEKCKNISVGILEVDDTFIEEIQNRFVRLDKNSK